jgi:histidine decarboxylase
MLNYEDFQNQLNPNYPAIINLNIGTTVKGATDNLDKILEVLSARKIEEFYIHCDGALGGMLAPYLSPDSIDFQRPINSLAISGHKFIGCPFPCGIVVTHNHLD